MHGGGLYLYKNAKMLISIPQSIEFHCPYIRTVDIKYFKSTPCKQLSDVIRLNVSSEMLGSARSAALLWRVP